MLEIRKRFTSIDYLRVIATILITNSHFANLYPGRLSRLAFGGMFGDCLFFFISGFCLATTLSSFGKFLKDRVIRIYLPYMLCIILLLPTDAFVGWTFFDFIFPIHTYTFLPCILTLYPIFYVVDKMTQRYKKTMGFTVVAVVIVQLLYFFLIFDYRNNNLSLTADYSIIQLSSFFVAMLLGGVARYKIRNGLDFSIRWSWRKLAISVALLITFIVQSIWPLRGV